MTATSRCATIPSETRLKTRVLSSQEFQEGAPEDPPTAAESRPSLVLHKSASRLRKELSPIQESSVDTSSLTSAGGCSPLEEERQLPPPGRTNWCYQKLLLLDKLHVSFGSRKSVVMATCRLALSSPLQGFQILWCLYSSWEHRKSLWTRNATAAAGPL